MRLRRLLHHRRSLIRLVLLAASAAAATMVTVGCTTRHEVSADFEPVWDKLVVPAATFPDTQPSGVAVSRSGRLFVSFPYWAHKPSLAVAEVLPDGSLRAYPSRSWNRWDGHRGPSALRGFVCAQALYVDDQDFLWVLDSGNPRKDGVITAGPKLFKIDLTDDSIAQVFYFDHQRDLSKDSYLADFRIDEANRVAYVTDSGRGGIFVVNLRTWDAHNVLLDDPSTKAEADVAPVVGSRIWRTAFGFVPQVHSTGIELSPDGQWLYYHALTGRTLYRVPTALLRDPHAEPGAVAAAVQDLGATGSVVDGMWMDGSGDLFMTAIEKDAILVRRSTGEIETFVADQRIQWPDALAMGPDGYLYFTTSMRHLTAPYSVADGREQPYYVMKVSVANVERAVHAKHRLAEARRQEHEAQAQARQAAAQAQARQLAAEAQKQIAAQREADAELARRLAETAKQTKIVVVGEAVAKAQAQTQVAEQARQLASEAGERAAEAELAAKAAEEAARIAQLRAREAAAKAKALADAQHKANQSQQELAAARAAAEKAKAEANLVAQWAASRADKASAARINASQAKAEAEQLLQAAEAQAQAARQMQAAAEMARQVSQDAAAQLRAAELAEIEGTPVQPVQSVAVPVAP